MKILHFLYLALVLTLCTACNRAESAIDELDNFSQRVQKSSASWSDADWDDALQYADELAVTLAKCNLSSEQSRRVDAIKAEFWPLFVRHYWGCNDLDADSLPSDQLFFQSISPVNN